jgi:hypothetical protein
MKVVRNQCQDMTKEDEKAAQEWINVHITMLQMVQAEMSKSAFRDNLEAEFQMLDSSQKYYSQWTNCRVTADSISIIEYGQGNDPQSDPVTYVCLATVKP